MPSSRLDCPLSLKTPNMGNTGRELGQHPVLDAGELHRPPSDGYPPSTHTGQIIHSISAQRVAIINRTLLPALTYVDGVNRCPLRL